MNKKPIVAYLMISFVAALLVLVLHSAMTMAGVQYSDRRNAMLLLGLSLVPAVSAFLVSLWFGKAADFPTIRLWPVPWKPFLVALAGIPVTFALVYGVSATMGWSSIDWSMTRLINHLPNYRDLRLSGPLSPAVVFFVGFLLSLLLGVTICTAYVVGMEIGWRAFLLPKLAGYGRVRSSLVSGLFWGLWLVPLSFLQFGEGAWYSLGFRAVAMGVVLGVILAEVWHRYEHVGLNALCLGLFAAQSGGMWVHLAPGGNTATGAFGWVTIVVWSLVALVMLMRAASETPGQVPGTSDAVQATREG